MALRVLICGSRWWKDVLTTKEFRIETYVKALPPGSVIIHGDAPGADHVAKRMAIKYGHTETGSQFHANWSKYGDAAGPIRNQQMLDEGRPDKVAAFHKDIANSKGTKDMIARARKGGIPVEVFDGSGKSTRQTELE